MGNAFTAYCPKTEGAAERLLQGMQRFSQQNQRTQRWTPQCSHQRLGQGMEREAEWGRRAEGRGLVIESEREDEGASAARWLPRLDSQVDCI